MRRYLSLSQASGSRGPSFKLEKSPLSADDATDISTVVGGPTRPLPTPTFKFKKFDHFYSWWARTWKYEKMGSNVLAEVRYQSTSNGSDGDPWSEWAFVVVREVPREEDKAPYFQVTIKSPYLLSAFKEVMKEITGLSWNTIPLVVDPELLIAFLPQFETYHKEIMSKGKSITDNDRYKAKTVQVMVDEYLRKDYRATLASIENMHSHGEITFELLYSIMVPHAIMLTSCPVTGELQALELISASKICTPSGPAYALVLEGIDENADTSFNGLPFYRYQARIIVRDFKGTVKVNSLDAYPIQFHPNPTDIKARLIARGKKWQSLKGVHHMTYKGTGALKANNKIIKYNLNSRVMIDRASFRRIHPNYAYPAAKQQAPDANNQVQDDTVWNGTNLHALVPLMDSANAQAQEQPPLTDDELLITTPVLMGFSLSDKLWLEFNVEKVHPVIWNEEAFANLVLPADRKMLLQSLVEAHNVELNGFDDFIRGKGRGLIAALYGPPGVGKTLSAEATSEHVKRPLYVVGAGDLGTDAAGVDAELSRVFELATAWKAIVLIDEADVFLEQRSLHDLERNAVVAVYLRHLEYYPGILMMTTNRVKTFDEAFLSRIHIALHFHTLPSEALKQVWVAFLLKSGASIGPGEADSISDAQVTLLSQRPINGRQVKNAVRTASSLALSRNEKLHYEHILEVLDVMDQFTAEFKASNLEI